ncbi:TonB-dependent receptor domain-containing protein [Sandarakinorhabdus sp.]|uniref:TonB-dependent receptor n=1 Tax=Sandarakinorhabdus sp. TaxID=1916663 RepID=UPI00286E1BF9|nr:TonB-dependent receptor [Sandarakinorhabdus sp.]
MADDAAAPAGDTLHTPTDPEIIVTSPYARDRKLVATAVTVLAADALQRETRSTIGETLSRQPGVSATFFGPNASRPILRGLDAERVRVLTDGIGSFDVSNTSVDHAVAANPLLVDRVEIVRGPAALLYGSGAIGGVVNMRDLRIAREIPDESIHVDGSANFGTAARERGGALSVNLPVSKNLVLHADGSFLETGNYRTGGFVFSEGLRAAAEAEGGEAAQDAQARGRVANTGGRTWDIGGGFTWIGDNGANFGVALSHLENRYGIPGGLELGHEEDDHDGEHAEEAHVHEDITLDMRQTRVDVRAAVPLGGAFEELKFRGGWADYRHDEIESDGAIGTSFFNKSWEARLELVQRDRNGWKGATGVQVLSRNFDAQGEEAYIPLNQTRQFGLFTLQEFDLGAVRAEVGARFEHSNVTSQLVSFDRDFNALSLSAGLSVPLGDSFRFAISAARSERAPSAEEMLSNGAHAATGAFEIGDRNFRKERQLGLEAVLRGRGEGWRLELSSYFNRFDNFIFLNPTGLEEDGLPVFRYAQADARFFGFEIEGALKVAQMGDTRIEVTGLVDYVNASVLGGVGPAPRIPPLRMIGGIEAGGGSVGGRLEVEHVTRQSRITSFETETPAWTMVNFSLNWKPLGEGNNTTVMLQANNIFDVEARRHASFLKNVAPLMGRDFRLGVRFGF